MSHYVEKDTAAALTPTDSRALYVLKLKADVDALSLIYNDIKDRCDRCNQTILIISSIGALTSSITTIAGVDGWEIQVLPIVVQTLSGVLAAWIRFYDFPKRMESIINAKKGANDVKLKFEQSASITVGLWNDYTAIQHEMDSAITPDERNFFMKRAIRLRGNMIEMDAEMHDMLVSKMRNDGGTAKSLSEGGVNRSPRIESNFTSRKLSSAVGRRGSGIEFSAPTGPVLLENPSDDEDGSVDVKSSITEEGSMRAPPVDGHDTHNAHALDASGSLQDTVVPTLPDNVDV